MDQSQDLLQERPRIVWLLVQDNQSRVVEVANEIIKKLEENGGKDSDCRPLLTRCITFNASPRACLCSGVIPVCHVSSVPEGRFQNERCTANIKAAYDRLVGNMELLSKHSSGGLQSTQCVVIVFDVYGLPKGSLELFVKRLGQLDLDGQSVRIITLGISDKEVPHMERTPSQIASLGGHISTNNALEALEAILALNTVPAVSESSRAVRLPGGPLMKDLISHESRNEPAVRNTDDEKSTQNKAEALQREEDGASSADQSGTGYPKPLTGKSPDATQTGQMGGNHDVVPDTEGTETRKPRFEFAESREYTIGQLRPVLKATDARRQTEDQGPGEVDREAAIVQGTRKKAQEILDKRGTVLSREGELSNERLRMAVYTDIGPAEHGKLKNEDFVLAWLADENQGETGLQAAIAIADGLTSAAHSDMASELACWSGLQALVSNHADVTSDRLAEAAFDSAHEAIASLATEVRGSPDRFKPQGEFLSTWNYRIGKSRFCQTTLLILWIDQGGLHVAEVGDSGVVVRTRGRLISCSTVAECNLETNVVNALGPHQEVRSSLDTWFEQAIDKPVLVAAFTDGVGRGINNNPFTILNSLEELLKDKQENPARAFVRSGIEDSPEAYDDNLTLAVLDVF